MERDDHGAGRTHALTEGLAGDRAVLDRRIVAEEQVLRFLLEFQRRLDDSGLSQAEVARRIGVSRTQMNRWLRNEAGLNAKTMFLMASGLGFDLHLGWAPTVNPVPTEP